MFEYVFFTLYAKIPKPDGGVRNLGVPTVTDSFIQQAIEKDIASLEKKRKKLTDMYLDDKLTKEAYDDKYSELSKKLDKCERQIYESS